MQLSQAIAICISWYVHLRCLDNFDILCSSSVDGMRTVAKAYIEDYSLLVFLFF